MNFNTVDRKGCQCFCRGQYIFIAFPGQADDDMNTDVQFSASERFDGLGKLREGVSPVNKIKRPVGRGLKPQFHPDVIFFRIAGQKIDHLRGQAVGPCADGQADDIFLGQRLVVERFELFHRSVGVGKGLEISDKL